MLYSQPHGVRTFLRGSLVTCRKRRHSWCTSAHYLRRSNGAERPTRRPRSLMCISIRRSCALWERTRNPPHPRNSARILHRHDPAFWSSSHIPVLVVETRLRVNTRSLFALLMLRELIEDMVPRIRSPRLMKAAPLLILLSASLRIVACDRRCRLYHAV